MEIRRETHDEQDVNPESFNGIQESLQVELRQNHHRFSSIDADMAHHDQTVDMALWQQSQYDVLLGRFPTRILKGAHL